MDYEPTAEQQDLLASASTLLQRLAGPARAREVIDGDRYDARLMQALIDAGFADPAAGGAGPLEAELVTEVVAAAVGCVPFANRALVAPAFLEDPLPQVVVVLNEAQDGPVRFGAQADVFLAPRGEGVVRIDPIDVAVTPVPSLQGFPLADVSVAPGAGTLIGGATAESLRAWWQISLAAELVGYMDGALRLTTDYVSNRRQFGAPLGSLQAVQHRLAELFFRVEGARWLARRAAGNGALPADAAAAAVSACATAKRLVLDTHQLTGAMGLTREYDLFLWTLRAVALQQEAGGLSSHAAGLARTRWAPAAHGYQGEPTIVSVSRP
jgi:hypothetical protein